MTIWAKLAILVIVVGAIGAATRLVYKAGVNSVIVISQAEAIEQQNAAIEAARLEWEATREVAEAITIVEEKIVEKIRVVTKEVPKIVEKFVQLECRDLGLEYAGVLNAAVRASNSRSDTSADLTAKLDDAL